MAVRKPNSEFVEILKRFFGSDLEGIGKFEATMKRVIEEQAGNTTHDIVPSVNRNGEVTFSITGTNNVFRAVSSNELSSQLLAVSRQATAFNNVARKADGILELNY